MLEEKINKNNQFQYKGRFDVVKVTKEKDTVFIEKIKTGIIGFLYIAFFLIISGVLSYFSRSILIPLISFSIVISAIVVVFTQYKIKFDFEKKVISIQKRFLFYPVKRMIAFSEILGWKIKNGEIGYNIKIKTEEIKIFLNFVKGETTICRISKYEEALELMNWIEEMIGKT